MEGEDVVIGVACAQAQPLDLLWRALMEMMRQERPTEGELLEANGAAALALRAVTGDARAIPEHGPVSDAAQCGALYGYILGMRRGREAAARA